MRTREDMRKLPNIAGFKATMAIGAWAKRRKLKQFKPLEGKEEEEIATKIQAGYRGMKVREDLAKKSTEKDPKESKKQDDSGTEISGNTSPEDGRITAVEPDERHGVDSGTSFSSREVTPRQEKERPKPEVSKNEEYDENFEEESNESGEGSSYSEESSGEGESDSEEDDSTSKGAEGKTPFVLLKRLVGIMQIGTSKAAFSKVNKVGIVNKTETEEEKREVPDFSGKSSPQVRDESEKKSEDNKESDVEEETIE
jgi:hypothetical protein